jgi:hypothetical protein
MVFLYGCAERLTARNGGVRHGQDCHVNAHLRKPPGHRDRHSHEIGATTCFISHAHSAPFVQLLGTLAEMELRAVNSEQQAYRAYYWVDCFCQSELMRDGGTGKQQHRYRQRDRQRKAFEVIPYSERVLSD